jgi:hypothetical protein
VLHCFAEQSFLGAELAEDRDLVYTRRFGYSPGSRAPESVLREDLGGSRKNFMSSSHPGILQLIRPKCKQLLAYTVVYATTFYSVGMDPIARDELEKAFDAALAQVQLLIASRTKAVDGSSAVPQLEALANELRRERASALQRGTADRKWIQKTVRSVVEWVPDTKLSLIAALGRIVRAKPPD